MPGVLSSQDACDKCGVVKHAVQWQYLMLSSQALYFLYRLLVNTKVRVVDISMTALGSCATSGANSADLEFTSGALALLCACLTLLRMNQHCFQLQNACDVVLQHRKEDAWRSHKSSELCAQVWDRIGPAHP